MNETRSNTRVLVEGALMVAVAFVLAFIKLFELPQGGTISLEMMPLLLMSFRRGAKWGVATGFVHGFIQMILGFSNVLYCATLISQIGCILLDYLIAYSVLGLACVLGGVFKNRLSQIAFGCTAACFLRFVCHFISGMWLWGSYAGEGQPVWLYSLVYNGSYMLVDTILIVAASLLLYQGAPKLFNAQR